MKHPLRAVGVALAIAATPTTVQAQVTLGPSLAWHDDFDFGIGAAVTLPLASVAPEIGFYGDFLIFFPDNDNVDFFEFNGNLTWDFELAKSQAVPFVLAGLNLSRVSVDVGSVERDDTDLGLNVGGGVKFDLGPVRPTVGGRFEIEGGEGFVIFGSVPFTLGGG